LVDVKDIKRRPEALELAVFQNIVMKHIELARETLIKKYVSWAC
jgi:dynein heavy chain